MQLNDRQMATVFAALIAWEDELSEGERWLTSIYDFGEHTPLSKQEVRELRDQLRRGGQITFERDDLAIWKLNIPTYFGAQCDNNEGPWIEFSEPHVPALVHESLGIRVLLGSHDLNNRDTPDIQIERRPHGWAVFIHPSAGDPVACLYILDDGRTYLMPENYVQPSLDIVDDIPGDLDAL